MAQFAWPGKTWRLTKALDLREKQQWSFDDLQALIDGGGLCLDQGAEVLSADRQDSDKLNASLALMTTGLDLLGRARQGLENGSWASEARAALADRLAQAERNAAHLSYFMAQMTEPAGAVYHA